MRDRAGAERELVAIAPRQRRATMRLPIEASSSDSATCALVASLPSAITQAVPTNWNTSGPVPLRRTTPTM